MFPQLLKLGPLSIKTYGVFVALGFLFAYIYLRRSAKRSNISENVLQDIFLYAIVGGLAGARLNYVLLNIDFYLKNIWQVFFIWEGGLVFYGGFIAGAICVAYYIKKRTDIALLNFADLAAPALALGHFFGRLGCLFSGCCYGKACTLPWSVIFTDPRALAPINVSLHPTQIYEALGNFSIFLFLDRYSQLKHRRGLIFFMYLIAYSLLRFTVEFFRGDDRGIYACFYICNFHDIEEKQCRSIILSFVPTQTEKDWIFFFLRNSLIIREATLKN
jgi:phosphatidylglycerol:prolipoprotein diacylglycerol transferase